MKIILSIFVGFFAFSLAEKFYPCSLSDLACIGGVLAANSDCDPAVCSSIPRRNRFENVEYNAQYFNATLLDYFIEFKDVSLCEVSAFFIDTGCNRMVLAITCPNLGYISYRDVLLHRPGEADQDNFYYLNSNYPPVTLTANIPYGASIDLCSTEVFAYVDGLPAYDVKSFSPAAEELASFITSHFDIYTRETTAARCQGLFKLWVNSILCNFNDYCRLY